MIRWIMVTSRPAADDTPTPAASPDRSAEAFYYDVAIMRLNAQADEIRPIDSKASTIFTIGSTVLPITASLLSGSSDTIPECNVAMYALVAGSLFYVALAALFVVAYRFSAWDYRPQLEQWKTITLGRNESELQRWLGDACVEAYRANLPQLRRKARIVGYALVCLALEAACLTAAVLAPLPLF